MSDTLKLEINELEKRFLSIKCNNVAKMGKLIRVK